MIRSHASQRTTPWIAGIWAFLYGSSLGGIPGEGAALGKPASLAGGR